jgi:hypothetical protein
MKTMLVFLTGCWNAACFIDYNQNHTRLEGNDFGGLFKFYFNKRGVDIVLESKWEVQVFLRIFEAFANWDGEKHFLTMETETPKGILTIMKSPDGVFYYHRKNELYWDIKEIKVETDILTDIIWTFRLAVNKSINEMAV